MDQRFMKERRVLPLLLSMGIPMMISMLANSLYNIVDGIFVAWISEDAMTALSLVFPLQNLMIAIGVGFSIGTNAVIAQRLGARQQEEADAAATQGLMLSLVHGVLLGVICILVMPRFLAMFTEDTAVLEYGIGYSNIVFGFSGIVAASISMEKIFQAVGKMMISMFSMLAGCITNLVLDPLMIFGIGPFPEMGIQGAALATGIGQMVSLLVYLVIYIVHPINVKITRRQLRANRNIIAQMYAIGIAATLNMALPSLLVSALNAILAPFSEIYVLVLGVYYKLQGLLYQSANGLVQGMRPLMAYNYGAGEHGRVQRIYQVAAGIVALIMAAGMLLCLVIPEQLFGLFTQNADTIQKGAQALRVLCLGFVPASLSVVSCGALEALGKGMPSFVISLLRCTVVIIPAAYMLSRILGASGVWHAFWIAELLTAIASVIIWRVSGRSSRSIG